MIIDKMNGLMKGSQTVSLSLKVQARRVHANADILEKCTTITNRNPRNLEMLRIARKPAGYHLEKPGREFWHKLVITSTTRHITAEVHHFQNGPVVSASTEEWALKKQLYMLKDTAAYINLGRVMAQRCLESGIHEVRCDEDPPKGGKLESLLSELKKRGLSLEEPSRYKNPAPWDQYRPEKPWQVTE